MLNTRLKRTALVLLVALAAAPAGIWAKNGKELKLVAFPNPFSTDTDVLTIKRKTDTGVANFNAKVKVTIYTYNGKNVYSGTFRGQVRWSGFDKNGNRLAPGVYYIKMLFQHDDGGVNTQWYTVAIKP